MFFLFFIVRAVYCECVRGGGGGGGTSLIHYTEIILFYLCGFGQSDRRAEGGFYGLILHKARNNLSVHPMPRAFSLSLILANLIAPNQNKLSYIY